jgi:hypothetical protein
MYFQKISGLLLKEAPTKAAFLTVEHSMIDAAVCSAIIIISS